MLATGDDAPDIFWVNLAHLIEYLPAGYMLPLNDDVMELDKYSQAATDLLKGEDGSYYGVPFLLDPNVLIYNKAMFDEAGLEYPTEDWTWDDFRTAAAALTKTMEVSMDTASVSIRARAPCMNGWFLQGMMSLTGITAFRCLQRSPELTDGLLCMI